jgi:hypothetical protein
VGFVCLHTSSEVPWRHEISASVHVVGTGTCAGRKLKYCVQGDRPPLGPV